MRLVLLRDLHFVWVFIDVIKLELMTYLTFKVTLSGFKLIATYQPAITKRTA